MANAAALALQQLGGEWIAGNHGVRVCGWIVYTRKSPILNAPERASWEEQLGTHHLPDMLFGNSRLELVHEATGVVVSFSARDALQGWLAEKSPPVPVSSALEWQKRQDVRRDNVMNYDYTYTTPYMGSLSRRMLCSGGACHDHDHHHHHGSSSSASGVSSAGSSTPGKAMSPDPPHGHGSGGTTCAEEACVLSHRHGRRTEIASRGPSPGSHFPSSGLDAPPAAGTSHIDVASPSAGVVGQLHAAAAIGACHAHAGRHTSACGGGGHSHAVGASASGACHGDHPPHGPAAGANSGGHAHAVGAGAGHTYAAAATAGVAGAVTGEAGLHPTPSRAHTMTMVEAGAPAGVDWEAQPPEASGLDMALLTARDPILFYDEVVLYEDELADNGCASLTVKVRVMPKFWFVLLRYWLRVDGMLTRIRDTRLFCPFATTGAADGSKTAAGSASNDTVAVASSAAAATGAAGGSNAAATGGQGEGAQSPTVVYRECTHSEETFASLAQRGLPADSLAYVDSAAAAQVMPPGAKTCAKLVLV